MSRKRTDKLPQFLQAPALPPALCGVLFALVLALGLFSGDSLRFPDEHDFHQLALNLLNGRGYVNAEGLPTAFRPPGYALAVAASYAVHPSPVAAKVMNAGLLTLTAFVLAALAGLIERRARPFAPFLMLLYPVFAYGATTLFPQTLGTLLFVASVYVALRWPASRQASLMAGALFGGLILTIPFFMMALPFFALSIALLGGATGRRRVTAPMLVLLGAFLVVSPWTVRNAMALDAFVPVSTNTGINLLLGNNENTHPNAGTTTDISRYTAETIGMNEVQTDRHYRTRALEWIAGHPLQAATLYMQKALNHFNYRNRLFVRSEQRTVNDLILFFSYYALLACALIRLCLRKRFPLLPAERLLVWLYLCGAFLYAIFFTRIRFRIPFDALLVAFNAAFLGRLVARWHRAASGATHG